MHLLLQSLDTAATSLWPSNQTQSCWLAYSNREGSSRGGFHGFGTGSFPGSVHLRRTVGMLCRPSLHPSTPGATQHSLTSSRFWSPTVESGNRTLNVACSTEALAPWPRWLVRQPFRSDPLFSTNLAKKFKQPVEFVDKLKDDLDRWWLWSNPLPSACYCGICRARNEKRAKSYFLLLEATVWASCQLLGLIGSYRLLMAWNISVKEDAGLQMTFSGAQRQQSKT